MNLERKNNVFCTTDKINLSEKERENRKQQGTTPSSIKIKCNMHHLLK